MLISTANHVDRLPDNWEVQTTDEQKGKKIFSSEEVLDAYLQGKDEQNALSKRILVENLNKALYLATELTSTFKQKEIKCIHAFLKPRQITEFEALFVLSESDYTSSSFSEIYASVVLKEAEVNNKTFYFSHSFIPAIFAMAYGSLVNSN